MRIHLAHGGEAAGELLSVSPLLVRVDGLVHLEPQVVRSCTCGTGGHGHEPRCLVRLPLVVRPPVGGPALLVGLYGGDHAVLDRPAHRFPVPLDALFPPHLEN